MSLTKIVDGVEVAMSAEEEAAVRAEWEANQAPIVPKEVSMAQARIALARAGLLVSVDAAIDAMEDPEKTEARIAWEYRTTVRRDSELTNTLGGALGLTGEQMDALFIQAATL